MTYQRSSRPLGRLLWAVVGLAALAGCGKRYIIVETNTQSLQGQSGQRDVRKTETYGNQLNGIRSIAFRLPETCLTQTAGTAMGQSMASSAIMTTNCAVWMAELERAVAREGYRVISWDALSRLERQRGISTYQAAQQLGADMVFILNSLERNEQRAGGEAGMAITYFESDPKGNKLAPVSLREDQRKVLRSFADARVNGNRNANAVTALSATLDATAILSSTGESIWFYRWSLTRPVQEAHDLRILMRGRDVYWRPVRSETMGLGAGEDDSAKSSADVVHGRVEATSADPYQAKFFELVQFVAKDFVTNFRSGGT